MDLTSISDNALRKASRYGVAAAGRMLTVAAMRRMVTFERVHIYALRAPVPRARPPVGRTRLATIEDLLPLTSDPAWELDALGSAGLSKLFDAGHRCVVNDVEGAIAGYGWLDPHRMVIPKLRAALSLRPGEAHVYKDFTHPDFRGLRLGTFRYLHWLDQDPDRVLLTDFAFDNDATLTRVGHLGLERLGTATYVAFGARKGRWTTAGLTNRRITPVAPTISQVEAASLIRS